ncbi:Golgi apparatus membrane protein tvp23 [Yamadazyma tenuis]|uniref:Golgi apparatus membrane protein TVP23 n=1 Tax=Candida tenuis (strain ATCC 10573 / BCRC 21748 / CBS 615 / JCM 9827 / NBRC 10315 / NRRL Y-1498 / VKM Y-70) TaxID=590646 RepID=G3BA46_CANTC|nr:Golgi apparatus membrane protein TVP23 [Yamadazyma tenuis ATCC 10573]XP_006688921.1 uncharacterized protein CANTEDRAFT_115472 [Yamadazyma tenuis ATCC 10573]EGV62750.1 Golgi apparatus membrane protein TVP23 [Yamadazyma tenuis ATCC 10573]EGV62751.1 hypothetical protein CANTEDRAFT_115472 [Yamadazyma tenuis ATCC 10573]WEJ93260.1 Golgi apparatus membrane protein tvp23 [Yamadazyma tenuis]
MSEYTPIESDVSNNRGPAYTDTATGNMGTAPSNTSEWTWAQKLKESSHPVALLAFLFFRIAPMFVYIFGNFFIGFITKKNRFILHFIVLILLVTADFWNLKNISGRLLVGLRWWNEVSQTSPTSGEFENVWVFETADPNRYINPIDSKVFWFLLYGQPVGWLLLGVLAILKLEFLYLILIIITITLSLTNAVAFTRCDKFGNANNVATSIFSKAAGSFVSRFNPFG